MHTARNEMKQDSIINQFALISTLALITHKREVEKNDTYL